MGLFSSKKKTYSGVGSAVQNLLSNPLENTMSTVAVTSIVNNKDLGDQLKDTLSTGMGTKLRSFIDYAHQRGYTNLIGWSPSDITGETFSDSSNYVNYLNKYIYPNSTSTTKTPEVVTKDSNETVNSYILGNDEIVEKTYTRTKTYTTTVTNTNYEFQTNWYYQGKNSTMYNIAKFFNDPKFESIPENVRDSAQYFTNCSYMYNNGGSEQYPRPAWRDSSLTALIFSTNAELPVTADKLLTLSLPDVLDNGTCGWKRSDNNGDSYNEYAVTTSFRKYSTYGEAGPSWWGDWYKSSWLIGKMLDPYTALNLSNPTQISFCKTIIYTRAECKYGYDTFENGDTDYSKLILENTFDIYGGYALILPTSLNNDTRILSGNVTVTKTVSQNSSTVTTEYYVTEKWVNGELIEFNELEGAILTSNSTTQTLENTSFTHTDDYIYGSGNGYLDNIINTTKNFTEQFCPVMPIKLWGNMINSSYHSDWYQAERKLYKKLTGKTLNKWDEFIESFKDVGDSAKMIYYLNSIPINVDTDFSNEYFFHFFKWLAINFGGSYIGCDLAFRLGASVDTDFWLGYSMSIQYRLVKASTPIPCKTHGYARYQVIGSEEADDTTSKTWKGGFNGRNWAQYNRFNSIQCSANSIGARENYPNLSDTEYATLAAASSATWSVEYPASMSTITFYYKINDNLYEKIYLSNFVFTHYVRGTGLTYFLKTSLKKNWREAIDDEATNSANAGFAPIVIPIARGALESMGWYRQSNVYQVTHNVIISGYEQKTIKVKWYQTGFFSFILIVVIIVISIYTGGAAAAAMGAAGGSAGGAAAGATAGAVAGGAAGGAMAFTISNLAFYGLQAIACAVISKVITWAANKFIGGVAGTIIGAVASYIACSYFSYQMNLAYNNIPQTTTYWDSMNTFEGYTKMCQATLDVGSSLQNNNLVNQYTAYQNEYNSWYSQYQTEAEQVESWTKTMASWGNDNITNIMVRSMYASAEDASSDSSSDYYTRVEDPDTYWSRTMGSDFIEYNAYYISNYEEILNSTALSF